MLNIKRVKVLRYHVVTDTYNHDCNFMHFFSVDAFFFSGDVQVVREIGFCIFSKVWEYFLEVCNDHNSFFGMTWPHLKSLLNNVEMTKTYILNPLAPEFIPKSYPHGQPVFMTPGHPQMAPGMYHPGPRSMGPGQPYPQVSS